MSGAVIQLIVLAAIAIFLIFKLKSVLGTREGYEKPIAPETPDTPDLLCTFFAGSSPT